MVETNTITVSLGSNHTDKSTSPALSGYCRAPAFTYIRVRVTCKFHSYK